MSNQDSKSKKELSDKELQQATGGADIEGGGGTRAADINSTFDPIAWVDVEANINDGPAAMPPVSSDSSGTDQILSEERLEP